MKRICLKILLILVLAVPSTILGQILEIPDVNFKDALINHPVADLGNGFYEDADTNNDDEIQVSEAEVVVRLNVNSYEISSLDGIEYFINLLELECENNFLTSLDISQNINLAGLYCGFNSLTELDVSQNIDLGFLWCSNNKINSLDVSMLPNLINFHCRNNNINELDFSQNLELSTVWCGFNNLIELDVSSNSELTTLSCWGNYISSLDVSNNPKLYFLFCGANEIEELDVSQNPNLSWLQCHSNEKLVLLDLRNGYIQDIDLMWAHDTPNLECILVDDEQYANNQECGYPTSGWCIDETDQYIEEIEDCVIGIEEKVLDNLILIYPNPVSNILTIQNPNGSDIESVTLYDTLGRKVMESNEATESIDVSFLPTGIYFIHITTDSGIVTKKIVKE